MDPMGFTWWVFFLAGGFEYSTNMFTPTWANLTSIFGNGLKPAASFYVKIPTFKTQKLADFELRISIKSLQNRERLGATPRILKHILVYLYIFCGFKKVLCIIG